jgi:hypothetical protein
MLISYIHFVWTVKSIYLQKFIFNSYRFLHCSNLFQLRNFTVNSLKCWLKHTAHSEILLLLVLLWFSGLFYIWKETYALLRNWVFELLFVYYLGDNCSLTRKSFWGFFSFLCLLSMFEFVDLFLKISNLNITLLDQLLKLLHLLFLILNIVWSWISLLLTDTIYIDDLLRFFAISIVFWWAFHA